MTVRTSSAAGVSRTSIVRVCPLATVAGRSPGRTFEAHLELVGPWQEAGEEEEAAGVGEREPRRLPREAQGERGPRQRGAAVVDDPPAQLRGAGAGVLRLLPRFVAADVDAVGEGPGVFAGPPRDRGRWEPPSAPSRRRPPPRPAAAESDLRDRRRPVDDDRPQVARAVAVAGAVGEEQAPAVLEDGEGDAAARAPGPTARRGWPSPARRRPRRPPASRRRSRAAPRSCRSPARGGAPAPRPPGPTRGWPRRGG